MKHKTILQAERLQLLQRLENNKRDIQEDVMAIRNSIAPVAMATNRILQTSRTINRNPALVELAQLGVRALPGKYGKSHTLRIAAQIALPMLVSKFLPQLSERLESSPVLGKIIHTVALLSSAKHEEEDDDDE